MKSCHKRPIPLGQCRSTIDQRREWFRDPSAAKFIAGKYILFICGIKLAMEILSHVLAAGLDVTVAGVLVTKLGGAAVVAGGLLKFKSKLL